MVSGVTSVTKLPESKFSTLLLKTTPAFTGLGNELLSTPRETGIPLVDRISTLADVEPNFSTEESASENTQRQMVQLHLERQQPLFQTLQ